MDMEKEKNQKEYNKIIANKSNPILEARNELTKQQLRLFNIYLALINPMNKGTKKIKLKLKDFARLAKIQVKASAIQNVASTMLAMNIDLAKYETTDDKPYNPMRMHRIAMWNMFSCEKNDEDEWEITMEASQAMEPYIFDIKELGYTSFNVLYSLNLKSENSMKLYEQVSRFKKIGVFEIKIKELLERMWLQNHKAYQSYGEFQRTVIKPCIDDINKNTDILVTYRTKQKNKKGHATYAIVFFIKYNQNNSLEKYNNKSIIDMEEMEYAVTEEQEIIEPSQLYENYLVKEIKIKNTDAQSILKVKEKTHTSDEQMVEIIEYSKNQNPKNIVGYIIKAMEDSYNITTTKKKDYEKYSQRTYTEQDMKTLEEQLLNKK